jgi:hypothetical protein
MTATTGATMSKGSRFAATVDADSLADAISYVEFFGVNSETALRIAINRSLTPIRVEASKRVRDQVRLSAAYVKDRTKVIKATKAKLRGALSVSSRGLLLSRYSTDSSVAKNSLKSSLLKAPPTPKKGIKVRVKPRGPAKTLGGGSGLAGKPFYIMFPSRVIGIAARKVGGGLKIFYGASLSQVFDDTRDMVIPFAEERLQTELGKAAEKLLQNKIPTP